MTTTTAQTSEARSSHRLYFAVLFSLLSVVMLTSVAVGDLLVAPKVTGNIGNVRKLKDARLKSLGIDAEDLKKSIVGNGGSRFNVSVGDSGEVFLIPVKKGAGPPIPTGFKLDELPNLFPRGGGR